MPSPFPGMDPYLEGYLWPDFHHRLATEISRRLTPMVRPRYVTRIELYTVEDESPEAEVGILYPDVEVLESRRRPGSGERASPPSRAPDGGSAVPAPLTIPVLGPVEVRVATVEIRDAGRNELVTTIEIVSPVNKRDPGRQRYREKRQRLYRSGVGILELDLLRRGRRPLADHPKLPEADYLFTLTRSRAAGIDVWPTALPDELPALPVPLREPDPDVSIDLQACVAAVYDEAAYELSVDYHQDPPPPALSDDRRRWLEDVLERRR